MQKNSTGGILDHSYAPLHYAILPVSTHCTEGKVLRMGVTMSPKQLGGINPIVSPDGLNGNAMALAESFKFQLRG
jgi:hypothetical protein